MILLRVPVDLGDDVVGRPPPALLLEDVSKLYLGSTSTVGLTEVEQVDPGIVGHCDDLLSCLLRHLGAERHPGTCGE